MPGPPPSRVLVLRIEREAEPIAGTLTNEDGDPYPFQGWIGLARALERALGEGQSAPGPALGGGHPK